jgi:hypothetical protein
VSSVHSDSPEVVTSEERWRRWDQRGRNYDARFMRRARRELSSAAVVVIGGGRLAWLLR